MIAHIERITRLVLLIDNLFLCPDNLTLSVDKAGYS